MKRFNYLLVLVTIGLLFNACSKELSEESGFAISNQWSFAEDNVNFSGPVDSATLTDLGVGFEILTVNGTSADGTGKIMLGIVALNITPGTYDDAGIVFSYYTSGNMVYEHEPVIDDSPFSITITQINSTGVEGTFSGEVYDVDGEAKIIVDGKFSAPLSGGPIDEEEPGTGDDCRLSSISYYDITGDQALAAYNFIFNSDKQVTRVELYDSVNNQVDYGFDLSYAPGRINIDAEQYFQVDANGRVTEFHGHFFPAVDTTQEVIWKYSYNTDGYMTTAELSLPGFPNDVLATLTNTWLNGNLTHSIMDYGQFGRVEWDNIYDETKPVEQFICFIPNYELIMFQGALNYGKNSAHALVQTAYRDYDENGDLTENVTGIHSDYSITPTDALVRLFKTEGESYLYPMGFTTRLNYTCF